MTSKQREQETEALQDLGLVPASDVVFGNVDLGHFDALIEQRMELKALVKSAEDDIKSIDVKLTQLMTDHDVVKVQHSGYKVSLCQGSSSSLSKERLLQLGVTATVIAEATKVSSYSYVLVTAPKPAR